MGLIDGNIRKRIVILGAGFAGLTVAQRLARTNFHVLLIDRQSHHVFQPLLHQVATAELEPSQISYPVRRAIRKLENVQFVQAEVSQIHRLQQYVQTTAGRFTYDFLVVATGSRLSLPAIPRTVNTVLGLKTVADAIAIQSHILQSFEWALHIQDPAKQRQALTLAVVGGGATGVELAGALAEWVHHSLVKDYALVKHSGQLNCRSIRIVLIHSHDQLLSQFRPRLQGYALRHLQKLGVDVQLQTRVKDITPEGLALSNGYFLPTKTILWTAGVAKNPPSSDRSQWFVQPTLQLKDDARVYAVGDVATHPVPMLAATAVQQAHAVARNLQRQVNGKPLVPYQYRPSGMMAILGRHAAVAQFGPITFTGGLAWLIWLAVHLVLLKGLSHRLITLYHWILSNCFKERVGPFWGSTAFTKKS